MKTCIAMDFDRSGLGAGELDGGKGRVEEAFRQLQSGSLDFTGWVDLPVNYDGQELERIRQVAADLRQRCTALVVIGIGGSYLGARALYDLLRGSFPRGEEGGDPRLFFAGQNMSAAYLSELLSLLDQEEVALCVISKSGTTTEPSMAFALLKDYLVRRYGAREAVRRICAITDATRGVLREEADREGYESFVVPDDIGGRYSVLTPVGLLPLAVAGFDPGAFLEGAAQARSDQALMDQAGTYALCRNLLYNKGRIIEIFESYEPRFALFAEWLKQLFGESEGKEGRGVFPASLSFSADLHSMGQFLQEGTPCFFQTLIDERQPVLDLTVPASAGPPLAGKTFDQVNRAALEGVLRAHQKADLPLLRFNILEKISPQTLGQVVYFFETACALSALLMGVHPFDQPGVEAYKAEMKQLL